MHGIVRAQPTPSWQRNRCMPGGRMRRPYWAIGCRRGRPPALSPAPFARSWCSTAPTTPTRSTSSSTLSLCPPFGGQWQARHRPGLGPRAPACGAWQSAGLPRSACAACAQLCTLLNTNCLGRRTLAPPAVWLAYTPSAFAFDLAPHLPACCASLAQYLQVGARAAPAPPAAGRSVSSDQPYRGRTLWGGRLQVNGGVTHGPSPHLPPAVQRQFLPGRRLLGLLPAA